MTGRRSHGRLSALNGVVHQGTQSPGLLRIFGSLPGVGPLVLSLTQIWLLVAMVVAIRQALDYHSTFRAVGVCLVGWVLATVIGVVLLLFVAP